MIRVREHAILVTMAPLMLALIALGVREATRIQVVEQAAPGPATEFDPPQLFLAAAKAPGTAQNLRVLPERSSARVGAFSEGAERTEQRLRTEGTLKILADESLTDLELDIRLGSEVHAHGWPRDVALHVRGINARCHSTEVPGVRACTMRCSVVIAGTLHETTLAVTWLRLPGGLIEMHGLAALDREPFGLPRAGLGQMLHADEPWLLGFDLVLRAER